MPESADRGDVMLEILEQVAREVAMHTGIRQQYIDAGWSEHAAEQMTALMVARAMRA